jgi:hypothetical protein
MIWLFCGEIPTEPSGQNRPIINWAAGARRERADLFALTGLLIVLFPAARQPASPLGDLAVARGWAASWPDSEIVAVTQKRCRHVADFPRFSEIYGPARNRQAARMGRTLARFGDCCCDLETLKAARGGPTNARRDAKDQCCNPDPVSSPL